MTDIHHNISKKNEKTNYYVIIILAYYSLIFSFFLLIGGFLNIKKLGDLLANILFLPVFIFILICFLKIKKSEKI